MKKIGLFLLTCILGSVVTSNATITRDTVAGIENLEWLEFEYTQGMSRDQVEAEILTTSYEGYRYATREETALLLDSYYKFDLADVDDGWCKSTGRAANDLLDNFGSTDSFLRGLIEESVWPSAYDTKTILYSQVSFLYGSAETDSTLYGHVALQSFEGKAVAGFFHQSIGTDPTFGQPLSMYKSSAGATIASLLVRDVQPVPEPATMLLFGTGLAGLIGTRIKKKKK